MRTVDVRCDVLSGLIGQWHAGTLRDADRDAYEQHLLFCPPCLVQNDKARLSFTALSAAATQPPPEGLVHRLTDRVRSQASQAGRA